MNELKEYRVAWQFQPHCNNPRMVNFVMAESTDNARSLITDFIERQYGRSMKTIHNIELYEKPAVGYVIK